MIILRREMEHIEAVGHWKNFSLPLRRPKDDKALMDFLRWNSRGTFRPKNKFKACYHGLGDGDLCRKSSPEVLDVFTGEGRWGFEVEG